jgi:hypothetical protein
MLWGETFWASRGKENGVFGRGEDRAERELGVCEGFVGGGLGSWDEVSVGMRRMSMVYRRQVWIIKPHE